MLLSLRSKVRRLETRLLDLERHAEGGAGEIGVDGTVEPRHRVALRRRRRDLTPPAEPVRWKIPGRPTSTRRASAPRRRPSGRRACRPSETPPAASGAPSRVHARHRRVRPGRGAVGGASQQDPALRVGAVLFFLGSASSSSMPSSEWIGPTGAIARGASSSDWPWWRAASGSRARAVSRCATRASLRSASGSSTCPCTPRTLQARRSAGDLRGAGGRRRPWDSATALRLGSRPWRSSRLYGGLLTPVILLADTDAAGALFTYLAILDLGVLLLSGPAGMAEARAARSRGQILYWGWLDRWYRPDRLPVAFGWATAFFWPSRRGDGAGADERTSGAIRLAGRSSSSERRRSLRGRTADPGRPIRPALADARARPRRTLPGDGARGGGERRPRVAWLHRASRAGVLAVAPAVTFRRPRASRDCLRAWRRRLAAPPQGPRAQHAGAARGGLVISARSRGGAGSRRSGRTGAEPGRS